jgi:hypothetical protein
MIHNKSPDVLAETFAGRACSGGVGVVVGVAFGYFNQLPAKAFNRD